MIQAAASRRIKLLTPRGQLPNWPIPPWADALRHQLMDPCVGREQRAVCWNQAALIEHHRGCPREARRLCEWHLGELLEANPTQEDPTPPELFLIQPIINIARLSRERDVEESLKLLGRLDDALTGRKGTQKIRDTKLIDAALAACGSARFGPDTLAIIHRTLLDEMVATACTWGDERRDRYLLMLSHTEPELRSSPLYNEAVLGLTSAVGRNRPVRFDAIDPGVLLVRLCQQSCFSEDASRSNLAGYIEDRLASPADKDTATIVFEALKCLYGDAAESSIFPISRIGEWIAPLDDEVLHFDLLKLTGAEHQLQCLARTTGYARLRHAYCDNTDISVDPLFRDLAN